MNTEQIQVRTTSLRAVLSALLAAVILSEISEAQRRWPEADALAEGRRAIKDGDEPVAYIAASHILLQQHEKHAGDWTAIRAYLESEVLLLVNRKAFETLIRKPLERAREHFKAQYPTVH